MHSPLSRDEGSLGAYLPGALGVPMRGLLLVNLGTPDSTAVGDVRRYLAEFLDDPRVLDMNPLGRKLLLNLVILPLRPKRSAAAYGEIWGERGSPLLFHSQDLAAAVQAELGQGWKVVLGMRYGRPTLVSVHANERFFRGDHVLVYRIDRFSMIERTSHGEIAEIGWFDPAALPEDTHRATRDRLEEIFNGADAATSW